jgi:RNA polymerase sigma factor (sigma-70 family)
VALHPVRLQSLPIAQIPQRYQLRGGEIPGPATTRATRRTGLTTSRRSHEHLDEPVLPRAIVMRTNTNLPHLRAPEAVALSEGLDGGSGSRTNDWLPAGVGVTDLFHLHYRRLVGLAVLLVDDRETAEDVVQEAFEGLYRRWRRLRDPHTAAAYLDRSVVTGALSRLSRASEQAHLRSGAARSPSVGATGVAHIAEHALTDALLALPRRQREVVVLRYYLDLSEEQIADWLGVSPGSVEQHAHLATATLQRRMESWS